jgi:Na+-driven multidrug efflux pump
LLFAAPFIIANFLFPEFILGLAIENKNATGLITDCIPTLYMVSAALLFFGPAMTWYSGVSGSGNTKTALLIETIAIASYLLIAWILGIYLKSDVFIIWLTEPYYFISLFLLSRMYMQSGKWKNKMV